MLQSILKNSEEPIPPLLESDIEPEDQEMATNLPQPINQQATQTKPKTPPITMAEFVQIDYSQLARYLQDTYLHDINLSERDVNQIRFVLSVYQDRDNLSTELIHDVCSQVVLFYYVQQYGWSTASQMCKDILVKPMEHGRVFDIAAFKAKN